jgi:G3E family GTPase
VTVVTGFLGSGKTTLLSRLLTDPALTNTAVLVNEAGEVGLDHHLLERVNETTLLLENGCVCCTRREELADSLRGLLEREARGEIPPVERVVVETSGLADPTPIPYTILSDPVLRHHYTPSRVVATADAVNGPLHLRDNSESVRQVAASDTIFVTKRDLVSAETADTLSSALREINPSATIAPADALGETLGEPAALLNRPPQTESLLQSWPGDDYNDAYSNAHRGHIEEGDVRTLSLTFEEPLDWVAFGVWLSALLYAHGEKVLRVKGLIDAEGPGPVSINGVQHVMHPPDHLDRWPGDEIGSNEHRSHLVFIFRGLEPAGISASLQAFATSPRE